MVTLSDEERSALDRARQVQQQGWPTTESEVVAVLLGLLERVADAGREATLLEQAREATLRALYAVATGIGGSGDSVTASRHVLDLSIAYGSLTDAIGASS